MAEWAPGPWEGPRGPQGSRGLWEWSLQAAALKSSATPNLGKTCSLKLFGAHSHHSPVAGGPDHFKKRGRRSISTPVQVSHWADHSLPSRLEPDHWQPLWTPGSSSWLQEGPGCQLGGARWAEAWLQPHGRPGQPGSTTQPCHPAPTGAESALRWACASRGRMPAAFRLLGAKPSWQRK